MNNFVETDMTAEEIRKIMYFCYSPKLKAFLVANGEEYILKGFNDKYGKNFWTFARTKRNTELLTQWKETSPETK